MADFHYKGAIVRMRIRNFMTYTDTEVKPGPNLNMILGPNGTGKSAIVCCIIVGLAGEVGLTGRGASPADFVKKNTDCGSTEIELFNDNGRNYIVERTIIITGRTKFKIDHKSDWKINGKHCLKSEVQALTKKLNIKVDNLCQFLPQDSVTQFVKMNPCELLVNTLKAAGDNQLVDDHQTLIKQTVEIDSQRSTLDGLKKSCLENEVNAKRLESEVHQLREREGLVKKKNICSQKIFYVKFLNAKANCDKAKLDCDTLKDDLKRIESMSEPFKRAEALHASEEKRFKESLESSKSEVNSALNLINNVQTEIENRKVSCSEEFAKFRCKEEEENRRESSIKLKRQELESLEAKLNEARDVDCSRQITIIDSELKELKEETMVSDNERKKIEDNLIIIVRNIDETLREKHSTMAINEKKMNLLRVKFPEAYKVCDWLSQPQNQERFSQKVFLPIMCEVNVKDVQFTNVIEHSVSRQDLSAFVCQTTEDVKTLSYITRETLRVKINIIRAPDKTWDEFDREAAELGDLSSLGVRSFLKDLIDGPDPIVRYLCANNNFHRIPVATNCSEAQIKSLMTRCPKFYVDNQFYSITKSRYDRQPLTVKEFVRDAQHLHLSLDQERLDRCKAKYAKLQEAQKKLVHDRDALISKIDELKSTWELKAGRLRELKNKHDEKRRLESLIQRNLDTLKKLETDKVDIEVERNKLKQSIEKINKQIMKNLEKYVEICQNYVQIRENLMKNIILSMIAKRNRKIAHNKYNRAQQDTTRLQADIKKKQQDFDTFKAAVVEHQKLAEEKISGFKRGQLDSKTNATFENIAANDIESLRQMRDDLIVRINNIFADSSNSIMSEFQRQKQELQDKQTRISELEASIKEIDCAREQIKKIWIPKLDEVIKVIDDNYKNFMQKLNYGGQVKLDFKQDDPDDFSAYGISIMVRYRDHEQLIPLSSTRQSGGERSVATMIYMLALQTKTTVPFRCVDEINQGMDKENERKVFELLVQTADSSSSQYFLVSPKLLSNLPYSEKMKIHIVFNGKKLGLAWNKL